MGLTYKVSDKEILKIRNEIFKEVGVPALSANGFEFSPYKTSWHGQYNRSIRGYIYDFCRLTKENCLEEISVYIIGREKWIQIYLNIFELSPNLNSMTILKDLDGLGFSNLLYRSTRMRLRNGEYKGPPIFYQLFLPEHKLGKFYTKNGYEKEVEKFKKLIQSDMQNIEDFIKRWHELYIPFKTDLEGIMII